MQSARDIYMSRCSCARLNARLRVLRLFMHTAGLVGNSLGVLTVPWMTARETAALIVVAASLLFFRVFRERCLLAWGAGWVAYGAFLWAERTSQLHATSKALAAFAHADFVVAMALFAVAALMSAQSKRVLTGVVAIAWVLMVCGAMQPVYFADLKSAGLVLDILCRLLAVAAVVELLRYRSGRIGLGSFLFGAGILTLN